MGTVDDPCYILEMELTQLLYITFSLGLTLITWAIIRYALTGH